MDPNFVLRHHRPLLSLPECNVRRDPQFSLQHYFKSVVPMEGSKYGLYVSQVIAASGQDQSIKCSDFLKRKADSSNAQAEDFKFAIDEVAAKLYLCFGTEDGMLDGGSAKLKVFDIDFDPTDHLGYRRIRVSKREHSFVIKTSLEVGFMSGFEICPSSGKLFGQYDIPIDMHKSTSTSSTVAEIEQPKHTLSVLQAKLGSHNFLNTSPPSRLVVAERFLFSRLNHLLIFFDFPNPKHCRLQSNKVQSKFLYVCSYNTDDLSLIECLEMDFMQFIKQIFTPEFTVGITNNFKSFGPQLWGSQWDILGHVHKYVIFVFHTYNVAFVKWPKNWYIAKKLPPVRLSRALHLNFTGLTPMTITGTDLYLKSDGKTPGPEVIKRLHLSPKLKDCRTCANCGVVETRKRRNVAGKRIAQFKVCRLCKKRNFHLFYLNPEIACHYCSEECQKLHWKKHKAVHKRSTIDRKNGRAPVQSLMNLPDMMKMSL